MNLNSPIKRILAKWPLLLILLMIPAIVFAQDDKDKDKKKNPPPPPKKSASNNTKPANNPPPKQTPPNQNPPPKDGPKQGVVPAPGTPQNPPEMKGDSSRGQRPDRTSTQGGQPHDGQPNGGQQVQLHDGNATIVHSGGSGGVTTIRTDHGVTINRTAYGRRVVTVRPGGVRIVSVGHAGGFVERPLGRPGYVQRTYVVGGRSYVRVYRSYSYRGIVYQRYVPAFYFGPRFYVWAYNPWPAPVYWSWGWGRPRWFFGVYFAPAPYYPSASLWLTDYAIAANLQAAYDAQQQTDADAAQYAAQPDSGQPDLNAYGNTTVSPAVRQAIADEVQRQLNAEKNAAMNPQPAPSSASGSAPASASDQAPPALSVDQRVFVVSAPLQVYDGDQPCSLTGGDIVSRLEDSPGSDGAVAVNVLTSKPSDCRSGTKPRIQVTDLQDMQNDLRAQVDEGMKTLSQKQGANGMPPAPDAATQIPNPNGQGTPDPDAVNQLKQQQQDADQTEKEVKQNGPGGNEVKLMQSPFSLVAKQNTQPCAPPRWFPDPLAVRPPFVFTATRCF
jgi:hypothetical protein